MAIEHLLAVVAVSDLHVSREWYTALFGSYACFVLLRTGHLWAAFVSHAFCNLMGLPDLSFLAAPPPAGRGGALSFLHPYRHWLLGGYAASIVGFGLLLFPLTEPTLFGGSYLWDLSQQ